MSKKSRVSNLPLPKEYDKLLSTIKQEVQKARIKAHLAVNQEMVMLYWNIGKHILKAQEQEGWGAKIVDQLSKDLRRTFPEVKGFSTRNLKYMRTFAEAYPEKEIVQQLAAQIPWFHNWISRANSHQLNK